MVRLEGCFYRGERTVWIETTARKDIDSGIFVLRPRMDRYVGFRDNGDGCHSLRRVLTGRHIHERSTAIVHGLTEGQLYMFHRIQVLAAPELDEYMNGEGFHGYMKDRKG